MKLLDDVTLAILAGGAGRRLGGVNKALIQVGGRTVLERVLDLAPLCSAAVMVVRDLAVWRETPVPVVADRLTDKGAPGGLHAALDSAATPWVLLVACDMPFIAPGFIQTLAGLRRAGLQWLCVEQEGRLQPMPGLYHRALLPTLEARLPANPSFRDVLSCAPGQRVAPEAFSAADPDLASLRSLNTADDLVWAGAVLPGG